VLLVKKTKSDLLKDKHHSFRPDVIAETMLHGQTKLWCLLWNMSVDRIAKGENKYGQSYADVEMSYGTIRRQLKNKYGAGVAELTELDCVIMKEHTEMVSWWNE
jgi:hypothetical protein|tara:strand:+ start:17 stop:328 length:312 start_codon:yes stop_codon:yes gene_type:complete